MTIDRCWLAGCCLALGLVTSSAYAQGKVEPKLDALLAACKAGKGQACLDAGVRTINGKGAPKDPARALELYQKACTLKVGKACGYASNLLLGDGGALDEKKSRALRERGCALDDSSSCNNLGSAWADGKDGVDRRDFKKARGYWERACKLRDGLGCFNVGNAHRLGEGVKVDMKQALARFQQSCDLGESKGCTELAILYYEGKAVPKNVPKAIELLGRACSLGSQIGCKNLQLLRGRQSVPPPPE
jgi:uncharacterized protein